MGEAGSSIDSMNCCNASCRILRPAASVTDWQLLWILSSIDAGLGKAGGAVDIDGIGLEGK